MLPHSTELPFRRRYEVLVAASFLLATAQGALQLAPSLEVNGAAIALTKLFVSPVLSLLIVLLVSRLRSRVAGIIFLVSLILALGLAVLDVLEGYAANLPFVVGAGSIVLDCFAAWIMLSWFRHGRLGPQPRAA